MYHEQVVAYTQAVKVFFDDYVACLEEASRYFVDHRQSDAHYYYYVLKQISSLNAIRSRDRMSDLLTDRDKLPPVIKSYAISDLPKLFWDFFIGLFTGLLTKITGKPTEITVQEPVSIELRTKLRSVFQKNTDYLLRAQEMLQNQIANLPKEAAFLAASLIATQVKCESILAKYTNAASAAKKSWLNNALRLRGAEASVKALCAQDQGVNTSVKLKQLAIRLNKEMYGEVKSTRTTKEKVDDDGFFIGNGFGALHYNYTTQLGQIRRSLNTFISYGTQADNIEVTRVRASINHLG